jgi:hypothetical protein
LPESTTRKKGGTTLYYIYIYSILRSRGMGCEATHNHSHLRKEVIQVINKIIAFIESDITGYTILTLTLTYLIYTFLIR